MSGVDQGLKGLKGLFFRISAFFSIQNSRTPEIPRNPLWDGGFQKGSFEIARGAWG